MEAGFVLELPGMRRGSYPEIFKSFFMNPKLLQRSRRALGEIATTKSHAPSKIPGNGGSPTPFYPKMNVCVPICNIS